MATDSKIKLEKITISDYELGVTLGTGKTAYKYK